MMMNIMMTMRERERGIKGRLVKSHRSGKQNNVHLAKASNDA